MNVYGEKQALSSAGSPISCTAMTSSEREAHCTSRGCSLRLKPRPMLIEARWRVEEGGGGEGKREAGGEGGGGGDIDDADIEEEGDTGECGCDEGWSERDAKEKSSMVIERGV